MPSKNFIHKLTKISNAAAEAHVQHMVFLVTPDGQMKLNGSSNFINALRNDIGLYGQVAQLFRDNLDPINSLV